MTDLECRQARDLLCAALDDELDQDTAAAVRQHLAGCSGCDELYRAQRTIKALLRRSCRAESPAPASLRERVWASVIAQCHLAGEASVTVNTTQTTISTTQAHPSGVLVRRTITGTVVRATYRGPLPPDLSGTEPA